MRYAGGKHRLGKTIAEFLHHSINKKSGTYLEPFVGSCAVLRRVKADRRIAGDMNSDIIAFWKAIQSGWIPPDEWDKKTYDFLRDYPEIADNGAEPLRGFLFGFCAFGGKWGDSFASGGNRNFVGEQHRDALRVSEKIEDVKFYSGSYNTHAIKNGTIYCDPPYAGTTNGYQADRFDHDMFWHWVQQQATVNDNDVFVSEYAAPGYAKEIWRKETKTSLSHNKEYGKRTEKIFLVNREVLKNRKVFT